MTLKEAKDALDHVIAVGRAHMYKPIQVAEILNQHRVNGTIDLTKLEDYRIASKRWRDDVSSVLVGRKCTSSARFQDNLFNDNAMPPRLLYELGKENVSKKGIVEAYIYYHFAQKLEQITRAINYVRNSTPASFNLQELLSFSMQPGLKRSIDKVYEAVVYALFYTLVNAMNANITLSIDKNKQYLVREFEDFTRLVLGIDSTSPTFSTPASLHRVGVTNAADRGLDMWANFGPAIQVKHLTLDCELVGDIVGSITADKIVIVCKDYEEEVLSGVLAQIGLEHKLQGIIIESELTEWYEKALQGLYAGELAANLLQILLLELESEFPSNLALDDFLTQRGYNEISLEGVWAPKDTE